MWLRFRYYLLLLFYFPIYINVWGIEYNVETVPNVRLNDRYNYVSNPDNIISAADVARINQLLRSLEDSLSIEVAVVALESIGNNEARTFATELFRKWGIGKKADDNGLLIQLTTEASQCSVVFKTGYGLEGVLPDIICYRLQQRYMVPDMREGNYSSGMVKGVEAVVDYLKASDYERADIAGTATQTGEEELPLGALLLLVLLFPGLILLFALFAYQRKHRKMKCPNCGKKTFAFVKTETIRQATYRAGGLEEEIYRCSNCGYTERRPKNTNRLRGGGGPFVFGTPGSFGGGGSRSGGGFGGFGGGSFGGGRSGGGGSISRF